MVSRRRGCYKRTTADRPPPDTDMDLPLARARIRANDAMTGSRRHDGSIEGYRRQRRALAARARSLALDELPTLDGRRRTGRQ
jgi:hypothetical protein